ncbi:MAG: hypothetical protein JNM17_04560, partial [Archangium sp.]|nr:hypothetical protein [Archangium sp.]
MTNNVMIRGLLLLSALALTACPSGKKCATNADCAAGQVCSPMSGTCMTGTGGGIGGGTGAGGGGVGGGVGGGMGGGTGGGGAGMGGGTGGGMNGGDTCQMPQLIQAGVFMGDTTGKTANYPGCTVGNLPGPDSVYEISVPAGQRLTVSVVPGMVNGNQYDTGIYLIEGPAANCDAVEPDGGSAVMCLDASDAVDFDATEETEYRNTTGAAKTIYIVIDSYFASDMPATDGGTGVLAMGPFTMTVGLAPIPADDTCAGNTPLAVGTPLTQQSLNGYNDDFNFQSMATGCKFFSQADRVYSITVPAGQRLNVSATPEGASDLDLTLNLVDGQASCGVACVARVDDGNSSEPETLRHVNRTGAPQAYLLIVDSFRGMGSFTLNATLDTPPMDDVCSGATALVAGTPLTNQTSVGYSNDYELGTNCGTGTLDSDRVYSVMVPNGQRGIVTVTPINGDGGTFAPSIALVQGAAAQCDVMPRVCSANASGSTFPHAAGYVNNTGMATNVFAIVDSSAGAGNFNIAFSTAAPLADDLCSTTTTTLTAGTRMDTLSGFFADYSTGMNCISSPGADRLYRVQVPQNQRLTVTVTPAVGSDFDPQLNLVSGSAAVCDSMHACVAGEDSGGTNEPDTMVFNNFGTAAFDGFVKVSDYNAFTPVTDYTLTTTLGAVPAGEACQVPQVVGA